MVRSRVLGVLGTLLLLVSCGGGSSTPTAPSSTPPPAVSSNTFTLSGRVIDDAVAVVAGASITVLDGANASRSATTGADGRYSLTGLSAGAFTVRVRRDGYDELTRAVTVTAATAADFTLNRTRLNFNGTMTGTYAITDRRDKHRYNGAVTATVIQIKEPTGENTISGSFRIRFSSDPADDWTGSFKGTLSSLVAPAQYTGTLTVSALISTGTGRCNGTRNSQTAAVTQTQIVFVAPELWRWEECLDVFEDTTIVLNK